MGTRAASGAQGEINGRGDQDILGSVRIKTPATGLTMENVSLDATGTSAEYASIGEHGTNITPSGTDVTVTAVSGSGSVPACVFPGFPGL